MLGHFIPNQNYAPIKKEITAPVPDDYFIWFLFKHKCVMCKHPATEINEIIPRSRSKKSILDWRNRVTLCRNCHMIYHLAGVTQKKIEIMKETRKEFLIAIGREIYV